MGHDRAAYMGRVPRGGGLNIAIDARWIFDEISGIGAYTRELIGALAIIDRNNAYMLYFTSEAIRDRTYREAGLSGNENLKSRIVPFGVFSPAGQLRMPSILNQDDIDLFHSTNYMIPLRAFPSGRRGRIACLVTIHDVIPLKFPQYASRSRKRRLFPIYRRLMIEVGRRADMITADSESSRRDILEHMRIDGDRQSRVRRIYCGVGDRYCPPAGRDERLSERTRLILYVGRADPYKNLTGLIEAFSCARQAGLPPAQLVIAGAPDPRYPEAGLLAKSLGLTDAVHWTGYLDEDALVNTYQAADLLVLPSRYEGFGLPVVEAMACGVPVICSNRGSLPEVAGDVAVQVDPDDTDGLAREITRLLTDNSLAADLSRRGIDHARQFNWRRTAGETLDLYHELERS